ncbi:tetraacyldisaccharide 4'-kinase [Saccharibacter sp. 17.LH.SD]|uniref:tetraacyldisaccharide 4'-kinase n=1 Tax=Saccharibacter sp. 17.LH.SD TaxID=2689393 RepID=UPI001370E491|nr:tetraacyldisaccharide 4'-kinase [Saccharibacter sp. 17.LH.SD]MXV44527.1 tetraacyldisaccharide 4'-kinase [Saccharibacter sp. 17.LH.SD]
MKLRPPSFWNSAQPGVTATMLSPFEGITRILGQRRLKHPSHHVAVPVLCCGNISVGGTGKTPLVLHLVRLLQERGHNPHIITRGYGGKQRHWHRVNPDQHHAIDVGDEALLLAQHAPTWRGNDRRLSADSAIAHGADCLVLDDGLQDPALHKDFSILTLDGSVGLGNGHLLPAGPLRERLPDVVSRVHNVVIFGEDTCNIAHQLPRDLPINYAHFSPGPEIRSLAGRQCIAFAGIGRPEKFFTMLRDMGLNIIRALPFPDHHNYTRKDIRLLTQLAHAPGTSLVTTEKDAVKLPQHFKRHVTVINIDIFWYDHNAPNLILDRFFENSV